MNSEDEIQTYTGQITSNTRYNSLGEIQYFSPVNNVSRRNIHTIQIKINSKYVRKQYPGFCCYTIKSKVIHITALTNKDKYKIDNDNEQIIVINKTDEIFTVLKASKNCGMQNNCDLILYKTKNKKINTARFHSHTTNIVKKDLIIAQQNTQSKTFITMFTKCTVSVENEIFTNKKKMYVQRFIEQIL